MSCQPRHSRLAARRAAVCRAAGGWRTTPPLALHSLERRRPWLRRAATSRDRRSRGRLASPNTRCTVMVRSQAGLEGGVVGARLGGWGRAPAADARLHEQARRRGLADSARARSGVSNNARRRLLAGTHSSPPRSVRQRVWVRCDADVRQRGDARHHVSRGDGRLVFQGICRAQAAHCAQCVAAGSGRALPLGGLLAAAKRVFRIVVACDARAGSQVTAAAPNTQTVAAGAATAATSTAS